MAKYCANCGYQLSEEAIFCPVCGTRVTEQPAQPVDYMPQAVQPAQPVDYMPQAVQPAQPVYPPQYQQNVPEQKERKPKRKSPGLTALIIVLAVVIAVEGVIAGVWFPGFFNPQKGGGTESDSSVVTASIPLPEDVVIDYTEKEIADAPAVTMSLSNENPTASAGDISVDFGELNCLDENETLVVKELPVHTNPDVGYVMKGYDFSLESGKHQLWNEVALTIPRSEDDGDFVMFVTQDPETGETVRQYHEVSEDGKSYIVYTTHFSLELKVDPADFNMGTFKGSIKKGDVKKPSTRAGLSSFYYDFSSMKKGDNNSFNDTFGYELMCAPVRFDAKEFTNKITNNGNTYLPSGYSLMAAIASQSKDAPEDQLPANTDLTASASVMLYDKKQLNTSAGDRFSDAGAVNDSKTLIDEGTKALGKLSLSKLWPGLRNIIKERAATLSASKGPDVFTVFSLITSALTLYMTYQKAYSEIEDGKYASDSQAYWGNWEGYTGTLLGLVGVTGTLLVGAGLTVTGGVLTVGAALGGIGLYIHSKLKTKLPYEDVVGAELNYRDYYLNDGSRNGPRRLFYYDMPEKASTEVGYGATGNIPRLSALTDEESQKLKGILTDGMKYSFGHEGIYAEDSRFGKPDFEWLCAVSAIYTAVKKTHPEKFGEAVREFYHNYVMACWDLGDEDFLSYSKKAIERRGGDVMSARLPEQDAPKNGKKPTNEMYAEIYEDELYRQHEKLFLAVAKQINHETVLEMEDTVNKELVPLLNTKMLFIVEDESLDDPKDFSKSLYNARPRKTGIEQPYDNAIHQREFTELYEAPDGTVYNKNYKYSYDYPMNFWIKDENGSYSRVDAPVFLPNKLEGWAQDSSGWTTLSSRKLTYGDYYPAVENFVPQLYDKTKNVVFYCTYFNWLMMGAPNAIGFKDVSKKNAKVEYTDFEIPEPDSDGVIRIKIKVNGDNSLNAFLGTWEGTQDILPSDQFTDRDWKAEGVSSKPRKVRLKLSIGDEGKLKYEFEATDPGGSEFMSYYEDSREVSSEKSGDWLGYSLEGSTLYIRKSTVDSGNASIPFAYSYKLTKGGSMTLSTIEKHSWEPENENEYWVTAPLEYYEATCTLHKVGSDTESATVSVTEGN